MKKTIIVLLLLFAAVLSANAQHKIGTKKELEPYKSELKSPDFLTLLKKSKQKVKKDSTEIFIFNGFSDSRIFNGVSDSEFLKCSFAVYKFRKTIYKSESEHYKYLDTISATYYVYQNQKIIYKEVFQKKNGQRNRIEIYYHENERPRALYSFSKPIQWFFDREGNIVDKYQHYHPEKAKKFDFDTITFTLKENDKIREDLRNMTGNTVFAVMSYDEYTVRDWQLHNKTKAYFKKLFNTNVDLYLSGISRHEIHFISEYGDFYTLMPHWQKSSQSYTVKVTH